MITNSIDLNKKQIAFTSWRKLWAVWKWKYLHYNRILTWWMVTFCRGLHPLYMAYPTRVVTETIVKVSFINFRTSFHAMAKSKNDRNCSEISRNGQGEFCLFLHTFIMIASIWGVASPLLDVDKTSCKQTINWYWELSEESAS